MSPRPAKTLLTGLVLVFANFVHAQTATVGVYFSSPSANQAVDSNLTIQVTTRSTYQISSVMATVKGRSAPLTYNSGAGLYTGTLQLAGLPVDSTDALSITATDVNNDTVTVSETILYDPPPVLTLGQEIIRQQVEGQQQTVLYTDPGKTGVYFLRLYDETRNRVIGYVKLLALGR